MDEETVRNCSNCYYKDREGHEEPCEFCMKQHVKTKEFLMWKDGDLRGKTS